MHAEKVLLFNPRSARSKHRVPNSILQVGASIYGKRDFALVDGNLERDPWAVLEAYLRSGDFGYFGCTVMPGPQLLQAIPFTKRIRELFPEVVTIWGGYFASNQYQVVLESGYVDFVVYGPGDNAFPTLLEALSGGKPYEFIPNLIWKTAEGAVVKNSKEILPDQDALPPLPYDFLDRFYPMQRYLPPTFLGRRTLAYHSSMGCPFKCSFCAVVPIYEARWRGKSAESIYRDVRYVKEKWGADSVEFHDNNFFVSEKRIREFAGLMLQENMAWWGEGRIDTIDQFSDDTLALMRRSGCRMIFFGAETGNDALLQQMDKGGKQTGEQIRRFAARMKQFDIIPEYSFVLGMPADTPGQVWAQIEEDIAFIQSIKAINPDTEIIIYVYSPVPTEGSELYERITRAGFSFPKTLDDWLLPQWESFDLRRNPLTPWLTPAMVRRIRNFETVLNARFPTVSDTKLTKLQRRVMHALAAVRYRTGFFYLPYEIKALQKFWLRYRQPEIEGM
ncbi:MAG: B12-binding domain-containing radical SAM protein [Saprospirales bacterium]|jgi:anaerobic magnesium-protoporphyrin IX monomethyl ester cyclase|nr:B12-binding domain-containing radical SAM protein [Saprospirales bacterium]MBK8921431.1 B12-binding domain-containing radical SAM protein [Saprospirales bacterium]